MTSSYRPKRVVVAVSGTIQDGFELRGNIDYRGEDEDAVEAIFLGNAVVRGAKMYLDVKGNDDTDASREYDSRVPHRVNPAMVLTGDANDANVYALYLVDERACLAALLDEPRMLCMTPDAVRIDLDDELTCPTVREFARAAMAAASASAAEDGGGGSERDVVYRTDECAVLAVVACYEPRAFVEAPPYLVRDDGTRVTSFRESLAAFAGMDAGTAARPGSLAWNEAVANALEEARAAIVDGGVVRRDGPVGSQKKDDRLYGTSKFCFRLSRRIDANEFNAIARRAGLTLQI
ncbi:hypothetical protein ACHAWF_011555 [Thalassiosira exigua]